MTYTPGYLKHELERQQLWRDVYVSTIHAGSSTDNAALAARSAVRSYDSNFGAHQTFARISDFERGQ